MNRLVIQITLISIINILSWSPSYGQEKEGMKNNKFGLGVKMVNGTTMYLPISIKRNLRIEPEISFFLRNNDYDNYKSKYESLSLGIGIFKMTRIENLSTYHGLRFGYTKSSNNFEFVPTEQSSNRNNTQTGYFIAPVIGAEYSFAKRFSIGPEVSIKYSTANGENTSSDNINDSSSKSIILNTGVMVRYYFK